MSPGWDWWDAWRSGDPDASQRALEAETDRSLDRQPERQPWGKRVEETVDPPDRVSPYRGGHGHHGRPGKGGTTERHTWSDAEYAAARRDYLLQNEAHLRTDRERREAEEARNRTDRVWHDEIYEAERHAHDDDPGEGRGLFW